MATASPQPNRFEHVLEDHRVVKALMADIGRELESRQSPDALCRLLGQLRDRLDEHFALEEHGGYFGEAMIHSPHLIDRANSLMAQHEKLLITIHELVDRAEAQRGDHDWWPATRRGFEAFRGSLLNHEAGEDRLIQDAYNLDLGAND